MLSHSTLVLLPTNQVNGTSGRSKGRDGATYIAFCPPGPWGWWEDAGTGVHRATSEDRGRIGLCLGPASNYQLFTECEWWVGTDRTGS